jgi:hypothetical protein
MLHVLDATPIRESFENEVAFRVIPYLCGLSWPGKASCFTGM